MSQIRIEKIGVTKLDVDAVVNAANSGLWEGGGVCGAIFKEAGSKELTAACNQYGHCEVGKAVITPGFKLKAKYIIHAVGPQWTDGNHNEPSQLYDAYKNSLILAKEHGCHSIGFPLISSGIFGYPKEGAWKKAIQACSNFIQTNPDYEMNITFAILNDEIIKLGENVMQGIVGEKSSSTVTDIDTYIKNEVHRLYWDHDTNCARTTLRCLGRLFNTKIEAQTWNAAIGLHGAGGFQAQCGLVEGTLMFLGIYFCNKGLSKGTVIQYCKEYAKAFTERFGSLRCCELRPGGFQPSDPPHLCESLTCDAIKFSYMYIMELCNGGDLE